MKEKQIPTAIYYKKPLHLQSAFSSIDMGSLNCDTSVQLSGVCLSLPMHAYLSEKDINMVCGVLKSVLC